MLTVLALILASREIEVYSILGSLRWSGLGGHQREIVSSVKYAQLGFNTNYSTGQMVINTQNTNYSIREMVINTQNTNYSTGEMVINTQNTNYSIGEMVINTQNNNYSTGGMVISTQNTNYSTGERW